MFEGGGYFQKILVILVMALLVCGPDNLPELGRRLGRAMWEFRRVSEGFRATIETNLNLADDTPRRPSAPEPGTAPPDEVAGPSRLARSPGL